jgi:phosphoheptose isomerase
MKSCIVNGKKTVHAWALDSIPEMTAHANDDCYANAFQDMLMVRGANAPDCFVAISSSGTSPNIVAALRYAKHRGLQTILLTGNNMSCPASEIADVTLYVIDEDMAKHEDIHLAMCHCLAKMLCKKIGDTDAQKTSSI